MIQLLRTSNIERAIRSLASRYSRVLVRNKNILWNQIRFRRSAVQDLQPLICLNPPEFDAQRDEWNARGGILVYDRGYVLRENIAAHHAQMVVEAPLRMADLKGYIKSAREVAVIYRPPTWDEHVRCVHYRTPPASLCKRFYEIVRTSPKREDIRRAIGSKEEVVVVDDETLCAALKVTPPVLWRIRDATFRHRDWKMVTRVVPRIVPEDDRALADVYNFILNECPELNGEYLIVGSMLARAVRFWKVALKTLRRRGHIATKETLFCYLLDGLPPDWEAIELAHLQALADLRELTDFVDSLPEMNLPPLQSSAPRARTRQSLSA